MGNVDGANAARVSLGLPPLTREAAVAALEARAAQEAALAAAREGRPFQAPFYRPTPPQGLGADGRPLPRDAALAADADAAAAAAEAAGCPEAAAAARAIADSARRVEASGLLPDCPADAADADAAPHLDLDYIVGMPPLGAAWQKLEGHSERLCVNAPAAAAVARLGAGVDAEFGAETAARGGGAWAEAMERRLAAEEAGEEVSDTDDDEEEDDDEEDDDADDPLFAGLREEVAAAGARVDAARAAAAAAAAAARGADRWPQQTPGGIEAVERARAPAALPLVPAPSLPLPAGASAPAGYEIRAVEWTPAVAAEHRRHFPHLYGD